MDEQNFTTVPSSIVPLEPIAEGAQFKFDGWFGQHLFCFVFKNQNCVAGMEILINFVCIYFWIEELCVERSAAFLLCCWTFVKMTSPQGMDELFWGRDHEDVNDWAERFTMAAEVRDLTVDKLFKIAKLNLRGRVKKWFRRLQPVPADWAKLRTLMV